MSSDQLRDEAIRAVHDLEATAIPEPSVEQYVDTVLRIVAARLAAAWDEGWARGLHGADGWDGVPVRNPYRAAVRAEPPGVTSP